MKFTIKDLLYFENNNESDEDISQIKKVIPKTIYTLYNKATNTNKRITQLQAIRLLGREKFLSGIERSAFHWTSVREINDNEYIEFDSSKYFEGVV